MNTPIINIAGLKSDTSRGDEQNVLGTLRAVCDLYKHHGITVQSTLIDLASLVELKTLVRTSQIHTILIGAGNQSLQPLIRIQSDLRLTKRIYTAWSSHQLCIGLKEAAKRLNSIALPRHIVTPQIRTLLQKGSAKLVETIGVPHNMQPEDLEKPYHQWKHLLLKAPIYTLAVLGGDAPTSTQRLRFYTPQEATVLARLLITDIKKRKSILLATNGPRTSKYDPITGKPSFAHYEIHPKTGHPIDYQIDPVSRAFITTLAAGSLKDGVHFQFFDFKFGKKSPYKALLGAVARHPGSQAYLPGESTSMISEGYDCLPSGSVTIYDTTAMNHAHHAHVSSLCAAGYAHRLSLTNRGDLAFNHSNPLISCKPLQSRSAAQIVAESIFRDFAPSTDALGAIS